MSSALPFYRACRNIVAVGRNYVEHAKELKNPVPKQPLLFLKPASSLLPVGHGPIEIPHTCKDLHHEVELGVVIGKKTRDVSPDVAAEHIKGYFLALDMTARDLQDQAKSKGLPWSVAKGYDTFCPVSEFISKERIPDPANVQLWCKVNDQLKQNGNTKDMIFSIPYLISYISTIFTLEEGDCILTGTPEGVGPLRPGETISAGIEGVTRMKFQAVQRPRSSL